MASIHRSALVQYSSEQMFDLINDVEKYPEFMRGCKSATVISQNENELIGQLCLAKAGINQEFTTRNILKRPRSIEMGLIEGNFKDFRCQWTFEVLALDACKVTLQMDFKFDFGLVEYAAEKLISSSANSLVDSLVTRAKQVYG